MTAALIELGMRLALVPALIAAATLAGRRWGLAVGSWLAGLPIVSAPILCFCGMERGLAWTCAAAAAALMCTVGVSAFCLAYAWCARKAPWWASLTVAYAAYAACALVVARMQAGIALACVIACGSLALALYGYPRLAAPARCREGNWELPLRMAAAAVVVLGVTWAARHAEARLCGALTTFPTAAAVLGVFNHRTTGAAGAAAIFRGLTVGMVSMVAFFLVVALDPCSSLWGDIAMATLASMLCHGLMLLGRRWLLPAAPAASAA